jgi:GTPase SAR1 family protein
MNLLIDKEIDLNKKDHLNTKSYAKSLANLILSSPNNTPMTIGLFGEWGSGKSSIIKTLNEDLNAEKSQKIKFVVYDAWKYSNDSFRRMFLLKVQDTLGLKQSKKMSSFYVNKNTEVDIKRSFNLPYLTLIVIALLLALGIYAMFGNPGKETITIAITLTMLGFLTNVFSKAFNEYKVTTQQPYFFAPEQFEECFNEIVGKALKKSSSFKKITNFIQGEVKGDIDKLVIVIDNIDRCHKETAYELLTNTKNFIDTGLDVVFLIPVDDNALKKHIFKNENNGTKESEEFLRKYFNVTVRIKPYKVTEIFDFAASINNENSLGFKPDTINIIAKEYASNPRRIIQFYNNLQLELILMKDKYKQTFIDEHEIAICKFLIIREEWHKEYLELCQNPELFFTDDYQTAESKSANGYQEFLDSTFVSTRSITYDVLQKILINSDNYDVLPDSILNQIKTNDFTKFADVVAETGYTEKRIIDHLLFSLNKAVKSNLFTTEIPELLDQIYVVLVNIPELDTSYYGRLEEELRKNIATHIGNAKKPENLIAFNDHALQRNITFMETAIKSYFRNFEHKDDKFFDTPLFEIYEAYYKTATGERLKEASKGFPNYLNSTKLTEKLDKTIKPDQLEILYTKEIIDKYLIDKSTLIWNDKENYNRWIYLSENLPQQNQLLTPLMNDVERSLDEGITEAENYIEVFNTVLFSMKNVKADEELIAKINIINDKIFITRRTPGYSSTTKYLENLTDERKGQTIGYLFESYRITNGSESAAGWIKEYVRIYGEDAIKTKFLSIILSNELLNFETLKPVVQDFKEVNEQTNAILVALLYQETAIYSDEEIKLHLDRIVESLKTKPQNEKLLLEHLPNERAQKILPDILIALPEDEFKKLNPTIQTAAFDQMTHKSNIGKYKTNFGVLNIVATHGNPKHTKRLVNTIKSNLLDLDHSQSTLKLISSLAKINQSDADELIEYILSNKIADMGFKKETEDALFKLRKRD